MTLRNRISQELGVGMSYSETMKDGRKRFTYINCGIHVDEAKQILVDDGGMTNIEVTESWVNGKGLWVGSKFFSSGRHYLRVYVTGGV